MIYNTYRGLSREFCSFFWREGLAARMRQASDAFRVPSMARRVAGEILHVDEGYHVVGMKSPAAPDISVV